MRTLLTSGVVLSLLTLGCAPVSQPIYIERFMHWEFPADFTKTSKCTVPTDDKIYVGAGQLDVGAGEPRYYALVKVKGGELYTTPEIKAGGIVVEHKDRNNPILDKVDFTYTSVPKLAGLKGRQEAIYAINEGETVMSLDLLGDGVASVLEGISEGDKVALSVGLEVKGYMSGTRDPISTGVVIFPIEVTKTALPGCALPRRYLSPCFYTGQTGGVACCDGAPVGTYGCSL